MSTFFNKAKVQVSELITQAQDFVSEKYEQAGKVFSISSAWGQILTVLSNLANMILYYIEDSVTELNINTATRVNSVQGLARLAGHDSTRAISSTGEIEMIVTSTPSVHGNQILIPNYSKIKCINNGRIYTLDMPHQEMRLSAFGGTSVNCKVIQGEVESQTFTGNGQPLQSWTIVQKPNTLTDHFFVRLYVNGKEWKKYDSLRDIPRNAEGFLCKTGITGGLDIYTGNGNFGKIPVLGSTITVEYLKSAGFSGNLRENEDVHFEWIDSGYSILGEELNLNEFVTVKMSKLITFGANPEPVNLTRLIAPHQSRSMVLARPENYVIFLEKFNYFSVIDAYSTTDDGYVDDDNVVYLFLIPDIAKRVPDGDNYFTVPQTYFSLTEQEKDKVLDLIEDSGSRILSTVTKIVDPIVKRYVLNVSLVTFEGFSKATIREQIIDRCSSYFLSLNRRDRIPKSDIIKIIENIDGVDSVNVHFVSEANEARVDQDSELIGIDEFGDVVIGSDEIPVIRGGWTDSRGLFYYDTLEEKQPSSLNIEFKSTSKLDIARKNFAKKIEEITG
jgi:hypothetical protein